MNLGGVTTSVINFCNELTKRGEQVHFLNMGKENSEAEKKMDTTIKRVKLLGSAVNWKLGVDDFKGISLMNKIKLFPMALLKKATNRSEQWLRIIFHGYSIEEEYDAVVAFRQCAPCYYFVLNCTRSKKKIAFIHGDINYMGDISSWDIYFKKFDAIACVSGAVRIGFQKKYPDFKEKFFTVYNMFNISDIHSRAKERLEHICMDKNVCNIVTVARIENSTKRIDLIPKVCEILKKNVNNKFHWYIVGDGPDLQKDKSLSDRLRTDDKLTFCGSMENPYPMIEHAAFTVLTSKTEAYSMVVMESLILGKPIVVSRYAGVEEAVEDGVTGLIADQSVEDLAKKIEILILNHKMQKRLSLNIASSEISNDKAYKQFMDCICL